MSHHNALLKRPDQVDRSIVDAAVSTANRATSLSPLRKRQVISAIKDSTSSEIAAEGYSLLKSCSSAICVAQGDLLAREALGLANDLQEIFSKVISTDESHQSSAVPSLGEMLYKPYWKPRGGSSCSIPGVPLISNPCGRIKR